MRRIAGLFNDFNKLRLWGLWDFQ